MIIGTYVNDKLQGPVQIIKISKNQIIYTTMKDGKIHGSYVAYHLNENALDDISEMKLVGKKFVEFVSKFDLSMLKWHYQIRIN